MLHCNGVFLLSLFMTFSSSKAEDAIQLNRQHSPDDPGLARYVSRPDLRAPRWNMIMHHETLNSPGLWFVAPYKGLAGEESDQPWVGPCIYDGNGELIWSGGTTFNLNVEDFRISNVKGEKLLTMMTHEEIYVLGNDYSAREAVRLGGFRNTHELNFVDGGTRVLSLEFGARKVSEEESRRVRFDGRCEAQFDGFSERDVTVEGWPSVFDWSSNGKIDLEESTMVQGSVEHRCRGWDAIHGNSVDKTPEGDYLFSARHTDTVYKISSQDGSILWRLGGVRSSFDLPEDLIFSRQHDVRYRGRNDTHILLSILDNSLGDPPETPTHDFSRSLLIAIDEQNMQASLEKHYDHPYRDKGRAWAPRRGNVQLLSGGNVFVGWSERAIQSEHTADGQLIWEAVLQVDWLGSYRNYKFEGFVGAPRDPPDAVARVQDVGGKTITLVHVSWNGATEVETWNLYRTSPDGQATRVLVDSKPRAGFETALEYAGYASFLVVEAIDKQGTVIGRTHVVRTVADGDVSAEALTEEERWLKDVEEARNRHPSRFDKATLSTFAMGLFCGITIGLMCWQLKLRGPGLLRGSWRRHRRYTSLSQQD